MEKINVLVTAAGGPTAVGIFQCLKNENNINLIGADSAEKNIGSKFCNRMFLISKFKDIEKYKNDIKNIVIEENIHVIFPTLQDEIKIFIDFKEELIPTVAIPVSKNYQELLDKELLYKFLKMHGFEKYIPKYEIFDTNTELKNHLEKKFKNEESVFIKNVNGHGGIGAITLTSKKKYIQSIEKGENNIFYKEDYLKTNHKNRRMISELLIGKEYSVDILIYKGEIISVIPRNRYRISNGIVIDGKLEENLELISISSEISLRLISNGFINMQFIYTPEGYKLIDLNSRFCGSQIMSYGGNVNFPLLFIQYNILNIKIPVTPNWNTRMIRYWDCYFIHD